MTEQAAVRDQALQWGMGEPDGSVSVEALTAADQYMTHLRDGSNFAVQLMFAYTLDGIQGALLLHSTPESCIQDNDNTQRVSQNLAVFKVGWMMFKVWWYPGKVLLNFAGMTAWGSTGGICKGTVEEVFGAEWNLRGLPTWHIVYGIPRPGDQYYDLLFAMLHDLGMPFYILATSGYSWRGYRALDVYLRPFVYGQPPPAMEAWYVVNTEKPWYQRNFLQSDDWYLCQHFVSWGQRESLLNQKIHQRYGLLPPPSSL